MSKELKFLETIKTTNELEPFLEQIKQALQRLEAIDNANPSEALKKLDIIENVLWDTDFHYQKSSKELDIIYQSLLKAQEQEKVLKWICDFLFLEPKQIVDKYYIKYMNREEGNYILEEVSKEEFDTLKEWLKCLKN